MWANNEIDETTMANNVNEHDKQHRGTPKKLLGPTKIINLSAL